MLLALGMTVLAAGCGVFGRDEADDDPPAAPTIERLNRPAPDLDYASVVREDTRLQLIARIPLQKPDDAAAFVADRVLARPDPRPLVCLLSFAAVESAGRLGWNEFTCAPLVQRFALRELRARAGFPNVIAGAVDASFEELRITFDGCRPGTYRLDGPLVPSKPSTRVFLLDQGDCSWHQAQGIEDGSVVATYVKPGPPED